MKNIETEKMLIAEDYIKRSKFIYNFLHNQKDFKTIDNVLIPKVIVHYWHSLNEIPNDVIKCIESWKILKKRGFKFVFFDDELAKNFIINNLSKKHLISYLKCHHPAMRCDYFRLCYLYLCGGFYIDSDELYLNKDIDFMFKNNNMKIRPFCYSIANDNMVEKENYMYKPYDKTKIYYFNNNPIITPPFHSLMLIALNYATDKLLNEDNIFDIQSTTGPGNLSTSLVYYLLSGKNDLDVIEDWDSISKSLWPLSYRNDDRNWRVYNGRNKKWFE